MAEGQHIAAPRQPALDELAENARSSRGAKAASVYDAYATFSSPNGFGQKPVDFFMCLVPIEAMQVSVSLNGPAATAQVTESAARQAATQEGICRIDGQQVFDRKIGVQGFGDYSCFVDFALTWPRARFRPFVRDARGGLQRASTGHRSMKIGDVVRRGRGTHWWCGKQSTTKCTKRTQG